jgi:hypothetical protein
MLCPFIEGKIGIRNAAKARRIGIDSNERQVLQKFADTPFED